MFYVVFFLWYSGCFKCYGIKLCWVRRRSGGDGGEWMGIEVGEGSGSIFLVCL